MLNKLISYLDNISPLDENAETFARNRLDSLVKPLGSLGVLEDIAVRLAGISGKMYYDTEKRCILVMASDNGVVEEGVASAPQSVTYSQSINLTRGITGAAVLTKQYNADIIVTDVGINADINCDKIINRKIRKSTHNIAKESAMTRDEALKAILIGIEAAENAVIGGYSLIGVGEMGIGNTTTSSAVLCALTGIDIEEITGKGAGLSDQAYRHKIAVIKAALKLNAPDKNDPIDVLAKVGGFDIAAMTGAFIGCACKRVPVVIDGFISVVAALTAARLNPIIKDYMIMSHKSYEKGFIHAANELKLTPYLDLRMRLGEGSGCPLMFSIIDGACAVIKDMATFEEAEIDDSYLDGIEKDNFFCVGDK